MKDKFLPIGTIVLLKGGKKELMITSYCIFPTGDLYVDGKKADSKGEMYDYGACTYPEGILDANRIFGFNHEQIEKICFMGYETDEHAGFIEALKNAVNEMQETIEKNQVQVTAKLDEN